MFADKVPVIGNISIVRFFVTTTLFNISGQYMISALLHEDEND